MTIKVTGLLSCVAGLLFAGCGGDDGSGGSCGNVQPCGGDVVGDWELVATCQSRVARAAFASAFSVNAMGSTCPEQSVRSIDVAVTGSILVNADSSYSVSFTYRANLDINIP